jgi:hypothetical protein
MFQSAAAQTSEFAAHQTSSPESFAQSRLDTPPLMWPTVALNLDKDGFKYRATF